MNKSNNWSVEPHFDASENAKSPKAVEITFNNKNSSYSRRNKDFSIDGIVLNHSTNGKTWEWKIATISNWPEFKTKTCHKEIHLPWCDRERIPYPCAWRRTCKKVAYVRVKYSGSDLDKALEKAIKECSKFGLAAALPLVLIGQFGAAGVAFLEALKTCLIKKGIKYVGRFSIGVYTTKTCGEWKRI
jgi:hypothetical protein